MIPFLQYLLNLGEPEEPEPPEPSRTRGRRFCVPADPVRFAVTC